MKQAVLGTVVLSITLIVASILFSLDSRSIRQQEIENALEEALKSCADIWADSTYTAQTEDEFAADLIQTITTQIESDSAVSIRILDLDNEKGIVSAEAVLKYKYPNGKTGTVSTVKTVIMEKNVFNPDADIKQTYAVAFYLPDVPEDELYKQYKVLENAACIVPENPEIEGKTFVRWQTADGTEVNPSTLQVVSDVSLFAVFN